MYSLENQQLTAKHKLFDISEVVGHQMSTINNTKSHFGTLPITSNQVELLLYFIKYILPSNDIVILLTVFSNELPKSLPISILEKILNEYKTFAQKPNSNSIEFKIKFNQIIKFNEIEFQKNLINNLNTDLNQIKNLMNNNLEQVLERNERIGLLVNKTDRINNLSNTFRSSTVKVKRKMWWNNFKFWFILSVSIIIALFVIYLIIR